MAKHFGRPRPRSIAGKKVVVRVGTRSKSLRPRECCGNVAFAGPGEEDIRVRAGKRAEPGWLAKPGKRTEPNISRENLSLGFRSRRPKTGESPVMAAAVDPAEGRSHQAHQDRRSGTDERLACEAGSRTNSWLERGRGAWSSPSGGSLVPKRIEGRRCVDSGFEERRISRCRRNGQGSRREPNGSVSHGLPCGVRKGGTNRWNGPL